MNKNIIQKIKEITLFLSTIVVFISFLFTFQSGSPVTYETFIEIEVRDGDTLWSIARSYSKGEPIQSFISVIKDYNNLTYDVIYPGQLILVPQESKINEELQ